MARDWKQEVANNWEKAEWSAAIDEFSHYTMAMIFRFSPAGATPIFLDVFTPNDFQIFRSDFLYWKFKKRFDEFGGWTYEMSKRVGHHERSLRGLEIAP